jgi:hypothetical protein
MLGLMYCANNKSRQSARHYLTPDFHKKLHDYYDQCIQEAMRA